MRRFCIRWPLLTAVLTSAAALSAEVVPERAALGPGLSSVQAANLPPPPSGRGYSRCVPKTTPLVFSGGIEVRLCYETPAGEVGEGRGGLWASGESGLLWFFSRDNAEVLIKVLDGCRINGHRWVFAAPVTDLAYNLYVSDRSGRHWSRHNRQGAKADTARDVTAFPCPDDEPIYQCTAGWRCLDLPGTIHRATAAAPDFETRLDVPSGVYRRAVFRFKVFHGGWNHVPSRHHNLFWFARDKHVDLFGFGFAKGRPAELVFRSDWGVNHTNKQKVIGRHTMRPGQTYEVVFDFDAAARRTVLTVTDSSGREVGRAVGETNISRIPFDASQRMAVGFGNRYTVNHPVEPAQPGWVWSHLHIELLPQQAGS